IAGVISRTMIDKYIMTFSGIFCMWLARLLVRDPDFPTLSHDRLRLSATMALTFAWLGCGYNLVTERNWSSLRWLDPFPRAIKAAYQFVDLENAVFMTHPSAIYYDRFEHEHDVMIEVDPADRVTIETSEYSDSPNWGELREKLDRDY